MSDLQFSYTMSDGTVLAGCCVDPELGVLFIPTDEDVAMSWEQSMEINRNLLLYGTIDKPEWLQ